MTDQARRLRQSLTILLNLDKHDLVQAGVIEEDDNAGWERFRDGPHEAALRVSGERFDRLAALVEARMKG